MKYKILFMTCIVFAINAKAQRAPEDTTRLGKFLKTTGFSIRKSFDASKDEGKPATFFVNRDFENGDNYLTADLGLKAPNLVNTDVIQLFPKVEWHKDGSEIKDKTKNTLNAGLNGQLYFWNVVDPNAEHVPGVSGGSWAPYFIVSSEYKRDFVKETGTLISKVQASIYGFGTMMPGQNMRDRNYFFRFRYYPYVGIENYRNLTGDAQKATFIPLRLFFETYPLTSLNKQYVQLTFDYTYRIKTNDSYYGYGNVHWLSTGINIYPDGYNRFGFGVDYSIGHDPADSFRKINKLGFGVKVKL